MRQVGSWCVPLSLYMCLCVQAHKPSSGSALSELLFVTITILRSLGYPVSVILERSARSAKLTSDFQTHPRHCKAISSRRPFLLALTALLCMCCVAFLHEGLIQGGLILLIVTCVCVEFPKSIIRQILSRVSI